MLVAATLLASFPDLGCVPEDDGRLCRILAAAEPGRAPLGPRLGLAYTCEAELRIAQAGMLLDGQVAVLRGDRVTLLRDHEPVRDDLVACLESGCDGIDGRGVIELTRNAPASDAVVLRAPGFLVVVTEPNAVGCSSVVVVPDVPVQ